MQTHSIAYRIYALARSSARALGVAQLARRLFGPAVGRMVFRTSSGSGNPVKVHDLQLHLAAPGRYPPLAMAVGEYEPQTVHLVQSLLKPGDVVIDVGAHVGYYALLAARRVGPGGKVYAFEAESENYALLCQNIELNGLTNVHPKNKAICGTVGRSTLYVTALDNGRNSMYSHPLPQRGEETVDTTTLDAFLEAEEWPDVDLIKIDVEGAEADVFSGMAGLVQRSDSLNIIVELNPVLLVSAGVDPVQILNQPTSWGFRVQCIDPEEGLLPLELADMPSLVAKLTANESSVNLFCTKG